MNLTKVTDYLSNKEQLNKDNELLTNTALLFENKSASGFGNIFLFERFGHAENSTYNLTSQITDHYMEDNSVRQDHWAITPNIYILSGFIGEIVYQPPKTWVNYAEKYVTDYLKPLSFLSPTFDSYTQSALNIVQTVESSYRRYEQIAQNIYSNITNNTIKRENQVYIMQLLTHARNNRQLFTVWTPFGTFKDLAMQKINISQGNSKYKSRLEIEFKQWKSVSSDNTREATDEEKKSYLANIQKMQDQSNGIASTNNGTPEFESTAYKLVFRK